MTEKKLELHIGGMHCPACPVRIEKVVAKIDGVLNVQVNVTTEKARIDVHQQTNISHIVQAIEKIGFTAKIAKEADSSTYDEQKKREEATLTRNFIFAVILTFPLAWASLIHLNWASFIYIPEIITNPFFQCALTIPIQFIIGFPFYERAFKAIRSGYANMDVLVVLSTSAAFFYSHYLTFSSVTSVGQTEHMVLYYETSAFIITFILLGRLLEAKTKTRTTKEIKKLYLLQTKTATLAKNGEEKEVRVDELIYGDIIVIRPGDKIPIDGHIIRGISTADESLLTGESIPVEKSIGHTVYAGTMNHDGVLKVKVTKQESETVLAQIIRIVEEAQISKPPIQRIADKVIHIFVPAIIFIAAITFVLSYLIMDPGDFSNALEKVIAVLIIACPCALGLATPTSIMVGSGRAAQLGILFKEGAFLELLGKHQTIVFDKTGTLTQGKPFVTDMYIDGISAHTFLSSVGAIEKDSNHLLARAILQEVKKRMHSTKVATNVVSIPGHGVKGVVDDKDIVIANPSYVKKNHLQIPHKASEVITTLENEGKTVIIVFIQSTFTGIIAIADQLKPSVKSVITRMKQMNFRIHMLTGDNVRVAQRIAESAGIHHVQAEITPQEKAIAIENLQHNGSGVIMVGDGMNDAPALAVADIGIAMGTGSDITIESGDVTIMKGDLEKVLQAIIISRKTMINIKQNLGWAFLYNVVMIPFAMFGLLAPWIAAAAMAFSSVSVVLNALRLNRISL